MSLISRLNLIVGWIWLMYFLKSSVVPVHIMKMSMNLFQVWINSDARLIILYTMKYIFQTVIFRI